MEVDKLFKKCIEEGIRLTAPYMNKYATEEEPTQQAWDLALVLSSSSSFNLFL